MLIELQRVLLSFVFLLMPLVGASVPRTQEHAERLRSPAVVRGFIGGESHDTYVIRARKGQTMTVRISWRREYLHPGSNHAEFYVGEAPDFDGDRYVKFGRESNNGRRWSGKIPVTKDYYIYVMAHPTAHYNLRVTVK